MYVSSSQPLLIKPLNKGPLDIIGDVHGEHEALEALLSELGYSTEGIHPKGRRLVFVGDLCDRGPDSPAVIHKVQELVTNGLAQCVLGNHELNLILGKRRQGNHWFEGKSVDPECRELGTCVALPTAQRNSVLAFLSSLPVALEREDLRIVHAAWHEPSIASIRRITVPIELAYSRIETAIKESEEGLYLAAAARAARQALSPRLRNPLTVWEEADRPLLDALGAFGEFMQIHHPLRVITSGLERCTRKPFFASGKWRFVARVPWWDEYDSLPVLFGHYWRWYDPSAQALYRRGEPSLFPDGHPPLMTERHRAFCVDFSVGGRFRERLTRNKPPYHTRLAALRWPERELVFDSPHSP